MLRRGAAWAVLPAVFGLAGCLTPRPLTGLPDGPTAEAAGKPEPTLPPGKSAELCLKTAETLQASGHVAEASAELEKARGYDPKLTPACAHKLAALADEQGNHARALAEFQKALAAKPNDADLLNDLGYSHYNNGDWAEAEKALRQAVKLQPKHERAWVNLGMTLAQQEHYEEALEAFQKAVRPADAYCNVGFILVTQGKRSQAREAYAKAAELDPTMPLARAALEKLDRPAAQTAAGR